MAITELNLTPGRREVDWALNVVQTDASAGVALKEATPDYRYGIKSIVVTPSVSDKWFRIRDGNDTIIGPLAASQLAVNFKSAIYCTAGNALVLQTEEAFGIHLVMEGTTGLPVPGKTFNPTPADEETGVSTDIELEWESESETMGFKVYLGTNPNNMDLVATQSETTFDPSLESGRLYYWRVDEYLGGDTVEGDIWSFTTS